MQIQHQTSYSSHQTSYSSHQHHTPRIKHHIPHINIILLASNIVLLASNIVLLASNIKLHASTHPKPFAPKIMIKPQWAPGLIVETSRLGGLAHNEASFITAIEITQQKNSQAVFWNFTSGWLVTGTCWRTTGHRLIKRPISSAL